MMFKTATTLSRTLRILFLLSLLATSGWLHAEDWVYLIRPGETVGSIWERFVSDAVTPKQILDYNQIENDRNIPVGTQIRIPLEWLKQAPAAAKILFLRGEATLYRQGADEAVALTQEDSLELGDRVVTGPYSVLSILFADGSRLLLGPGSEVSLDTLSAYAESGMVDTRLRVQRGRVESRVKPFKGSGSRFEIHTPAAVTMVRGTGFRVNVEGDSGLTRSEVFEGGVKVAAEGEEITVEEGYGTRIEPGKPPEPPTKLLDPPDLSAVPETIQEGELALEWSPLEGAESYWVQLMAGEPADTVLKARKVELPREDLTGIEPGEYRLLVSGIDRKGLEGLSAQRAFEITPAPEPTPTPEPPPVPEPPPPEPPPAESPSPNLEPPSIGPGWIDLNWGEAEGAWIYRLLIARDRTFSQPLLERLSSRRRLRLPMPRPGRYYVRVDALFEDDGQESHSMIYRLEIPWH